MAQIGRCLTQGSSGGAMSNNWIPLYSCPNISCAKNDLIVSKVPMISLEEHLHVYSNGGHMDYTMRVIMDNLPMDIYEMITPWQTSFISRK